MRRQLSPALAASVLLCTSGVGGQAAAQDLPVPDVRAQLVARQFTTLSSKMAAQIERITAREGEHFAKGQLLVALDCAVQQAQLEEARAGLKAAQNKKAVSQRLVELKSGGVLEAELAAAEAEQAGAKLRLAEAIVSRCAIAAPFEGRVVEQKARPHQYVQEGEPLLEILDHTALDVEFIAPSQWLPLLKPGQAFRVEIDETGKSYPARLTRIGAKIDPVSHTVKVMGELDGTPPGLTAGMSGRALIAIDPSG